MSATFKNFDDDSICFYNSDIFPTIDTIKKDCPILTSGLDTISFYLENLLIANVVTPRDYKRTKKIITDSFTNTKKKYTAIRLVIRNRDVLNEEFSHLKKSLDAIFHVLDEKYIAPYTKKRNNNEAEV